MQLCYYQTMNDAIVYDVIVVGAGMAGLKAAQTLQQQKKKVLVLEANHRLGGRVYTEREYGFPLDFGASWAHDLPTHNRLPALYDLQLDYGSDILSQIATDAAYDATGKPLTLPDIKNIETFISDFFVSIEQCAANSSTKTFIDNFQCTSISAQQNAIYKQWITSLLCGWSGAEFGQTAMSVWQAMEDEGEQAYVLSGYGTVIDVLAKDLPILLQHRVNQIDYRNDIIEVSCSSPQGSQQFRCKKIVVSVSLGVLKANDIKFMPELPTEKQHCIQQLGFGLLDKTALFFEKCFWPEDSFSLQRFITSDSPVPVYINYQKLFKQPMLLAMYAADTAEQLEALSEQERLEITCAPLKAMFPKNYTPPSHSISSQWRSNHLFRGSYAYLPPNVTRESIQTLAAPVAKQLFFAGEATHQYYATAHGAYASGLQVAELILATI